MSYHLQAKEIKNKMVSINVNDGKKPSITTKLVSHVIWSKPHKTELEGITSF